MFWAGQWCLTRRNGAVGILVEYPFSVHNTFLTQKSAITSAMKVPMVSFTLDNPWSYCIGLPL